MRMGGRPLLGVEHRLDDGGRLGRVAWAPLAGPDLVQQGVGQPERHRRPVDGRAPRAGGARPGGAPGRTPGAAPPARAGRRRAIRSRRAPASAPYPARPVDPVCTMLLLSSLVSLTQIGARRNAYLGTGPQTLSRDPLSVLPQAPLTITRGGGPGGGRSARAAPPGSPAAGPAPPRRSVRAAAPPPAPGGRSTPRRALPAAVISTSTLRRSAVSRTRRSRPRPSRRSRRVVAAVESPVASASCPARLGPSASQSRQRRSVRFSPRRAATASSRASALVGLRGPPHGGDGAAARWDRAHRVRGAPLQQRRSRVVPHRDSQRPGGPARRGRPPRRRRGRLPHPPERPLRRRWPASGGRPPRRAPPGRDGKSEPQAGPPQPGPGGRGDPARGAGGVRQAPHRRQDPPDRPAGSCATSCCAWSSGTSSPRSRWPGSTTTASTSTSRCSASCEPPEAWSPEGPPETDSWPSPAGGSTVARGALARGALARWR